ncbi:MAG: ribonuclease H-like domain-containing protein [Planctomycetes bacterium]|nr:ribonuclease H-like domain-containing protein [Planctomycetota bacterium]
MSELRRRLERYLGPANRARPTEARDEKVARLRAELARLFPSGGGELPPPPSYRRHAPCAARVVPAAPSPGPVSIEEVVPGARVETVAGPVFLARSRVRIEPRPDRTVMAPEEWRLLGGHAAAGPVAFERILFLDTETTGLSGGTGTLAFLIGWGWFETEGELTIEQAFLDGPQDEPAALALLAERSASFDAHVTFNGRTFDLPLLETRYAMARRRAPFSGHLGLDLLPASRRLWGAFFEEFRLGALEEGVLGRGRDADVPGSEIPGIYFRYLRDRDARPLSPVFEHNARDIASMAALLDTALDTLAGQGPERLVDRFALGLLWERHGDFARAREWYARALSQGAPGDRAARAAARLSLLHKRREEWGRAIDLWEDLFELPEWRAFAGEEIAKFLEHREGSFARAVERVDAVLASLGTRDAATREDFLHRRERLLRRISHDRII